ncbi:hypothetical protein [Flavipsychrobacter stenotrophus]|nr:hypothetical protein [Flavipsychrobacter stenotrophus]
MAGRFTLLLFVPIFLFCSSVFAGDHNYFQHKKIFYLCSIQKECFYCESCSKEMYKIKIKNNVDKKIKSIFYQYYSPVYKKVITKEAVIEGDQIESQNIGLLYICVQNKLHWAISKIVYADDTDETFLVEGPLKKFHQDADECDCNITPTDRRGN